MGLQPSHLVSGTPSTSVETCDPDRTIGRSPNSHESWRNLTNTSTGRKTVASAQQRRNDSAQCDAVKDGPIVGLPDPRPHRPHDRGGFHGHRAAPAHCEMGSPGCDDSVSNRDLTGSDGDASMSACDVTGSDGNDSMSFEP